MVASGPVPRPSPIRLLVAVALIAGGWGLGYLSGVSRSVSAPAADTRARLGGPVTAVDGGGPVDDAEALAALGYLDAVEAAPAATGVLRHDPAATAPGVNLVVGAHAPEARLLDADGALLHRWAVPFAVAFPQHAGDPPAEGHRYWRRVALLPDGDLVVVYEGQGLARIDRDSQVRWARFDRAHHDVRVRSDGHIVTLTRQVGPRPGYPSRRPVTDDHIRVYSPNGDVVAETSVLGSIERSAYARMLELTWSSGDLLHTNTVRPLDGRHSHRNPAFAEGNFLVTVPHLDAIFVIDPAAGGGQGAAVWMLAGGMRFPHDGDLLDDGSLLVLDNRGHDGMSKVVELDPLTQQAQWGYYGTPENGFSTAFCGAARRLPNGNTLIVESDAGRAFEVTRGGEIVWELVQTERSAEQPDLVARLFDVERIAPGDPRLSWR